MDDPTPGSRLHRIWKGMKRRCQSPGCAEYRYYGQRGIAVCPEWQTFVGFLDWALTHGYGDHLQIDRVDANGWYEPMNCRWVTADLNVARQELDRSGEYLKWLNGNLTDDVIAKAKPRDRAYKLSDGGGLFVLVLPSGVKSWRYAYRFNDKHQLLTFGSYPQRSILAARELHAVAKSRVERGVNPAEIRRESKKSRERRHARRSTGGTGASSSGTVQE